MDDFKGRPLRSHPAVVENAILDMAEDLSKEWEPGSRRGMTAGIWQRILRDARVFPMREYNGYAIAKAVERVSQVDPDAELVEMLDQASHHESTMHERAVEQWVKLGDLKLSRKVGDRVTTPWGSGEIYSLDARLARYTVRPDDDPRFSGGGGWIVEAERCTDPVEEKTA